MGERVPKPRTTPETRAELRRTPSRTGWLVTIRRSELHALLDDADALAGALEDIGGLRADVAFYRPEAERYRAALQTIRDHYGQVCDEYDTCTHPACAASYGAWAVADEALAGPAPEGLIPGCARGSR